MSNLQELIDEGGQLSTEILKKSKRLEKIKKAIRDQAKVEGLSEYYGGDYIVSAGNYTNTSIEIDKVIERITGIDVNAINANDSYMIKGHRLELLIKIINITLSNISKIFTKEELRENGLIKEKTTKFHTISFKKI